MSSALGIAATTQVLRGLLEEGLSNSDVSNLSADISVSPPDKIDISGTNESNQLNLYMYMSAANQGWKNYGLPSRNADAKRVSSPPLALDLYYILSAYGDNELRAEMLLGYGMQMFHEYPIMSRQFIRQQLTPAPAGALPTALRDLATSGLAEQIEQIRVTLDVLSTEEMTRLWTAFGTKHRQCAFYKVTVVLIESKKPTRVALPVKKALIEVLPFKQPIIYTVSSREDNNASIIDNQKILPSFQLVIKGAQLKGDVTSVILGGQEVKQDAFISITDTQIILPISATTAPLKAGIHSVQVVHKIEMSEPREARGGFTSNAEAFVLSPTPPLVSNKSLQNQGNNIYSGTIRLDFLPLPVEPQQLSLLLNNLSNPTLEYSINKDFSELTINRAYCTVYSHSN
ncbi:MAG: DUF4255 domain-containing protein [Bacteroidota bacterium]